MKREAEPMTMRHWGTFHWPALQVHRQGDLFLSRSLEWSEKEHTREKNPPLPIGSLCLWLWLLVLSATFSGRPDLSRSHGFVTATTISLFAISAVWRSHTGMHHRNTLNIHRIHPGNQGLNQDLRESHLGNIWHSCGIHMGSIWDPHGKHV